jgi:hypothetical protein
LHRIVIGSGARPFTDPDGFIGSGCGDSNQPPVSLFGRLDGPSRSRQYVETRFASGTATGAAVARSDGTELYSRFECLAGTRARFQHYDTVGVFYVLHPLENYKGPRSRHRLTNVRFVGDPAFLRPDAKVRFEMLFGKTPRLTKSRQSLQECSLFR